jgi:hypothetical protein
MRQMKVKLTQQSFLISRRLNYVTIGQTEIRQLVFVGQL